MLRELQTNEMDMVAGGQNSTDQSDVVVEGERRTPDAPLSPGVLPGGGGFGSRNSFTTSDGKVFFGNLGAEEAAIHEASLREPEPRQTNRTTGPASPAERVICMFGRNSACQSLRRRRGETR